MHHDNENPLAGRLRQVCERIALAEHKYARPPDAVQLIAVSKTFPASAVREAALAGQRCFGENYLQEALDKIAVLHELDLEWHFIGPIQSNKTRAIAEHFDWVHSVDRLRIAERLNEQRPVDLPPLNVCLQVNVSGEHSKSGICLEALSELAQAVAVLPRLRLRGLMAIPAPQQDVDQQRKAFRLLAEALAQLKTGGLALDVLSMGMSDDLEAAIAEGSTHVRVGTAIFGGRTYQNKQEVNK